MRMFLFAKRNTKEILRDPINLFFGLGFPLVLLVLLSVINANIPAEANNPMFEINNLAPGLAMFGTAFMALFAGMLIAKDRTTSFLTRLFASPMKSSDFLLGYTTPLIIISAAQATITFIASLTCGLQISAYILLAIFISTIASLFFIGLGLLCGTLLSDKAVGGICGALVTNLAGWLSGVFIPLDLIGGGFKTFCKVFPFYHSVEAIKSALVGDFAGIFPHLGVTLAYTFVVFAITILVFKQKMRGKE